MSKATAASSVLERGVQVVAYLFGAFGGYLLAAAPPAEGNPRFAVGTASLLTLFALLFVTAIAKGRSTNRYRNQWLGASLVLMAAGVAISLQYDGMYMNRTFRYPTPTDSAYFAGSVRTAQADRHYVNGMTLQKLVGDFGGVPLGVERVWTRESIMKNRRELTAAYIAMVVTIAAALFCLTEGLAGRRRSQ